LGQALARPGQRSGSGSDAARDARGPAALDAFRTRVVSLGTLVEITGGSLAEAIAAAAAAAATG
jgi:hypothetical protein